MAKVFVQVSGGAAKEIEAETIGEVRKAMRLESKYSAAVNGEPEDDDYELNEFDVVSLAPSVKGGL